MRSAEAYDFVGSYFIRFYVVICVGISDGLAPVVISEKITFVRKVPKGFRWCSEDSPTNNSPSLDQDNQRAVSLFSQPMTLPINSNDNSARPNFRPISIAANGSRVAPRPTQLLPRNLSVLRCELIRQPEIRPDVVARARRLAADPNYPTIENLRFVAQQILRSRDLSEVES